MKPCARYKISTQNHKIGNLIDVWNNPLFRDKHPRDKDMLRNEILRWRTAITRREYKYPLVTLLTQNDFEDKASLVLVPLLASADVRVLKFIWTDEPAGQSLLKNLCAIPDFKPVSIPDDLPRLLESIKGVFVLAPESITSLLADGLSPNVFDRFREHCLFTLYTTDWKGIAIDLKIGHYPHMLNLERAKEWALEMTEHLDASCTGSSFLITSLNQPIGQALGPALELREALDVLKARGPFDLTKLVFELGADLLMLASHYTDRTHAKSLLRKYLQNGDALKAFKNIIQGHRGLPDITDDQYHFPVAEKKIQISSTRAGYIRDIDSARLLGLKNRLCSEHNGAGLLLLKKIGDTVRKKETLAEIYLPSLGQSRTFPFEVQKLFFISKQPPELQPMVQEKIKGSFRF